MTACCQIVFKTDVKDVKYISFVLAKFQAFKIYTRSFCLNKSMMTVFIVTRNHKYNTWMW
jgi:hypothetical protein